jgi:predicted chitinase
MWTYDQISIKIGFGLSITYEGTADGIYGPKTQKEMQNWTAEHWLRPLPDLYHGDYDTEAVNRNIKERGGDDFHEVGKPVLEVQKLLQQVGAYEGALDGWFGDKMKDAISLFQDAAEKGEFLVNGVKTTIEEKLTGYAKGGGDRKTQESLKKVVEENSAKVPKKGRISLEMIKAACTANNDAYFNEILPFMNKYSCLYEVNTPERIAHFLSQVGHESQFKAIEENLKYSEARMKQVFGCKAGGWNGEDCPPEKRIHLKLWDSPEVYANHPEALANYVYASRMGNGDESSGDGYKYRGRGLIQLTGKDNYQNVTAMHNQRNPSNKRDFVANPDLLAANLECAIESAFIWWSQNGLNNVSNGRTDNDVKVVTQKVNGGLNGLADRTSRFHKILEQIK